MNRTVVVVALVALGSLLVVPAVEAAPRIIVTSVIEGVDSVSGRGVLLVSGSKVNKLRKFELFSLPGRNLEGQATVVAQSKSEVRLLLPDGLPGGDKELVMTPRRGDPVTVTFPYRVSRLFTERVSMGSDLTVGGDTNVDRLIAAGPASFNAGMDVVGSASIVGTGSRVDFSTNRVGNGTNLAMVIETPTGNGPQFRFARVGSFVDVGLDAGGAFVVEQNDGTVLSVGTDGVTDCDALTVNGPSLIPTTFHVTQRPGDAHITLVLDASGTIITRVSPFGLELRTGIASKPGGGSWAVFSDARLKKDVTDLDGALDRLLRLRSVEFEYDDPRRSGSFQGGRSGSWPRRWSASSPTGSASARTG